MATHKKYYETPTFEELTVAPEQGIAGSVTVEKGTNSIDDYDVWSDFGD